jgi:ABC-2 type transport system permease protein
MANFVTVFKKELADHLGSKRFIILFVLILALATMSAYQGATSIKTNMSQGAISSGSFGGANFLSIFTSAFAGLPFTYLMMYFGPVIGLALGFDAINKERSSGSLSVLLTQPIYRDAVVNGKFLAGISALSLMAVSTVGIMVGLAIPIVGFGPTAAEVSRIIAFTLLTILYLGFWLALSLLFSTVFKKTTTAMVTTVFTWIFFLFVITILASFIANAIVPIQQIQFVTSSSGQFDQSQTQLYMQRIEQRSSLQNAIQSISPSYLYSSACSIILSGYSVYVSPLSSYNPNQGIDASWPQFTAIAVGMVVCFIASYILFLRKEIRP